MVSCSVTMNDLTYETETCCKIWRVAIKDKAVIKTGAEAGIGAETTVAALTTITPKHKEKK